MSSLSRNSCAKVFGNWSRGKNFRVKNTRGGGAQRTPPPASLRVKKQFTYFFKATVINKRPGFIITMGVFFFYRNQKKTHISSQIYLFTCYLRQVYKMRSLVIVFKQYWLNLKNNFSAAIKRRCRSIFVFIYLGLDRFKFKL